MTGHKIVVPGFGPILKSTEYRLIASVEGLEKNGKSTFALSAPGPLAIIDMDTGLEGVIEKWVDKKDIIRAEFNYRDATNKDEWERMWMQVKTAWKDALASRDIRTLIGDTATEMWELVRLARFGKLDKVMPLQYGPVNTEFRDLIRSAYMTNKNVVLLHKQKSEYVNDKRTGKMERSGFSDMGYLVQINLKTWRDEDNQFGFTVIDCRQSAGLNGEEYVQPMNTFQYLAADVFPQTDLEYWE